jgi:hypothetical protein
MTKGQAFLDRINPLKLLSAKDKLNCQILQLTKENAELKAALKASQDASSVLLGDARMMITSMHGIEASFSSKYPQ